MGVAINYACLHIEYRDANERFRESPESKFNAGLNYLSEKFYSSFPHYVSFTRRPQVHCKNELQILGDDVREHKK